MELFLQSLRSYLIDTPCINESFKGIHLLEIAKINMPFLLVKQNDFTNSPTGQTNVDLSIEIHVNSMNMNDDLRLSLILSSILEGAEINISPEFFATFKWQKNQTKMLNDKRIITHHYTALVREKADA